MIAYVCFDSMWCICFGEGMLHSGCYALGAKVKVCALLYLELDFVF